MVGFDDVPNIFIAPNSTPTNPEATLTPINPNVKGVHWYWFDFRSVHRLDRPVPITANGVATINWQAAAAGTGTKWDGVPGYMVIGTEVARSGAPANFDMFGDAWLEMSVIAESDATVLATIPCCQCRMAPTRSTRALRPPMIF